MMWHKTLHLGDVFHDEAMAWEPRRDVMVERIKALDPQDDDLQDLAYDLGATADEDEWDRIWPFFYDWADENRVWVETWPRKP